MTAVMSVAVLADEHISLVKLAGAAVVGIAGLTVSVMVWIDTRMDGKIAKSDKRIMGEIQHLKELLEEKGLIHTHHRSGDEL
jgi:3-deoxy-D-manno-octulosonic acid (KDO) 8-phosphate synthase